MIAAELLRRTSTGLLITEATSAEWTHRLGAAAPLPFSALRIRLDAPDPRVLLGVGDADVRRYPCTATALVPELIGTLGTPALLALGRAWGEALQSLHRATVLAGVALPPRPLRRAAAWLGGGWAAATEELGADGLAALAAWAERMTRCADPVVLHGHPGMAHWVVGASNALLTGEDLGLGDAAYDVAWVLGEIAELEAFYPAARPALDALREGFLAGYGGTLDQGALRDGIAFRLAQHAYDWRHYAGAAESAARSLLRVAAERRVAA